MKKPVRILLLEDSALDAELMLASLDAPALEFRAETVQDRESFLAAMRKNCPDIILSDYSLPAFDGRSALALAQQHCPDVPFVFLSGAMGEEVATESLKLGAVDFVLKQRMERLPHAVQRALAEARQKKERRQAEEELARKARELTVLNADLQQFAYAASHDLQEPLRTISLFSRLLATRYKGALDAQADEYLGYVESAARHMSALLEDLLVYARIPAQERDSTRVDVGQLVDETIVLFQATLEENKGIVTRDELPTISCNGAQLGLVFQNLISNGLKYHGEQSPRVHIFASQQSDAWVFGVRDNGIGFDQNYADQVFGLFKRLNNRDYPGTGLGLAICKRIVEVHGGRIWAESTLNAGSTFLFTIPFETDWKPAAPAALIEGALS